MTQQTESHEDAFVLPLLLAVRVCDNVNMKPRIAAICAPVVAARRLSFPAVRTC